MDAVEPCETVPRTDPQIAIVRLRDAADGALGQTVLNIPLFDGVLGLHGTGQQQQAREDRYGLRGGQLFREKSEAMKPDGSHEDSTQVAHSQIWEQQ